MARSFDLPEPPFWRGLCTELQREPDPAKFEVLLAELNRLLTEYYSDDAETPKAS
jgi:hypothetical protein